MSRGRLETQWAQTSSVMALIANCHRDPKASLIQPDVFNPMVESPRSKVGVGILKDVFLPHLAREKQGDSTCKSDRGISG